MGAHQKTGRPTKTATLDHTNHLGIFRPPDLRKLHPAFTTAAAPLVAAAAVLPTVPLMPAGTATHPDAALIAMGRERIALVAHIDDSSQGHTDEAIDRLRGDWRALDVRIMAMVPQTVAGIAVQLAVVWSWLELEPGGEDRPIETSSLDRRWLWTAKLNAERLAGQGGVPLSAGGHASL